MREKLVIVCACNNEYAPYCGVMITSIFCNNREHEIEINILSNYIDTINRAKFEELARLYSKKIFIIHVDNNFFENLPVGGRFVNISIETYYRLKIVSLFPQYDKILYLDCDMIVRHDLKDLWETDISDYAIGSIQDNVYMVKSSTERLCYPISLSYYNAGMGLYNLAFLREFQFDKKVSDFINNNLESILFHDQDILNVVCKGHFKSISVRWNMLDVFLKKNPHLPQERLADLEKWIEDPGIIHFSAKYKPWNTEAFHPYQDEFWKYTSMSPWSGLKKTKKFKGMQSLTNCIKRKMKYVLSLLGYRKYQFRKLCLS